VKTLTFTASANTGFQYMPVVSYTIGGATQALMDGQTTFRLPRSDGMSGAELAHTLVDKLDQMMRADVNGQYPEGQHSVLTDAIRATVDLLQVVTANPSAAWSSLEGDDGQPAPDPLAATDAPTDTELSQGDPLPGTSA